MDLFPLTEEFSYRFVPGEGTLRTTNGTTVVLSLLFPSTAVVYRTCTNPIARLLYITVLFFFCFIDSFFCVILCACRWAERGKRVDAQPNARIAFVLHRLLRWQQITGICGTFRTIPSLTCRSRLVFNSGSPGVLYRAAFRFATLTFSERW